MNNEDQLYLFDEDGGGGASVVKEQDDGLGVECLSRPSCLVPPTGSWPQVQGQVVPDGEHRAGEERKKASRDGPGTAVSDGRPVLSGL